MLSKVDKKCSNCAFFSGVHCHGHGDFWGDCNLLKLLLKLDGYFGSLTFDSICMPEDICKFQRFNLISYYKEVNDGKIK